LLTLFPNADHAERLSRRALAALLCQVVSSLGSGRRGSREYGLLVFEKLKIALAAHAGGAEQVRVSSGYMIAGKRASRLVKKLEPSATE
jgi:hypothetical protein